MLSKSEERKSAVILRNEGKSYSEIKSLVSVSQSTLSLWLRDIPLSEEQIHRLEIKKKKGQSRGGSLKKQWREVHQKEIIAESRKEIKEISQNELWLLGIIAYACEGSKQKENNVSQPVTFVNSDPFLIKTIVSWLTLCCGVQKDDIVYSIYIHENANISKALEYWSGILNLDILKFGKPILKKHKIGSIRKNNGSNYHGLMRVSVKKSTDLNRKIAGWILGINDALK